MQLYTNDEKQPKSNRNHCMKAKVYRNPHPEAMELATHKDSTSTTSEIVVAPKSTSSMFDVKTVSDIELLERLGGGQFGDVYRGLWMVLFPILILNYSRELQLLH